MKHYYQVSFKYSNTVYCTNMVLAEDTNSVLSHYRGKYSWAEASEAAPSEVETAKRKGMPFVEL